MSIFYSVTNRMVENHKIYSLVVEFWKSAILPVSIGNIIVHVRTVTVKYCESYMNVIKLYQVHVQF